MTNKRPTNPTKERLLRSAQPAKPAARPSAPGPRNKAKLDFESLVKLRAGLRGKALDHRISSNEMHLLRELENLPLTMPKATKTPGTTDVAFNKVWNDFTARMTKAAPAIAKLKTRAGFAQ